MNTNPSQYLRPQAGFALVVSLSMMILLTVVAIGLLGLSSITLRTASQGKAQAEARANARMALVIAIGELQKQLGPDQRVSANAAILSTSQVNHPHWSGVWDSWIAGEASDAPVGEAYPSGTSHHQTIGNQPSMSMHPDYANKDAHFRRWLTSLNPDEATDPATPVSLALLGVALPDQNAEAIRLVGPGSLGGSADPSDFVSARLKVIASSPSETSHRSRYAWWVGDESQKARVMHDSYLSAPAANLAEQVFRSQAPGSMGNKSIPGLQDLTDDSQLDQLPSLATLDLVSGAVGRPAKLNFHHVSPFTYSVLADVREGGLKRDLNTLLERRISLSENGDAFMLYRFADIPTPFGTQNQRVPIQDLAAFYQIYDQTRYARTSESWREGVSYNSSRLPNTVQIAQPNLGPPTERFDRQYAQMHQSPVPVKIQILVTMTAHPLPENVAKESGDTHYIRLHLMPSVTFWNPTNLPLVMNPSDINAYAKRFRFMSAGFNINWIKNGKELDPIRPMPLAFASVGGNQNNGALRDKAMIFTMIFGTEDHPITFEPGEVRVFSYEPPAPGTTSFDFWKGQQAMPGWNPEVTFPMRASTWGSGDHSYSNRYLSVKKGVRGYPGDRIAIRLGTDFEDATNYFHNTMFRGAALSFNIRQFNQEGTYFRSYQMLSRRRVDASDPTELKVFNDGLIRKGFPDGAPTPYRTLDRDVNELVNITEAGEHWPLFQYALMAGVETSENSATGSFGGRKFASRPFLHSSAIAPQHIDRIDGESLYMYGWNWWIEETNSVLEANMQVARNNRSGYYGGGYTPEWGSSHVVQQEVPVAPPVSIASLSHAHLGGHSLAKEGGHTFWPMVNALGAYTMFPFTIQAIGNSYAHPSLPPEQAFRDWTRVYNSSPTGAIPVKLADHSYLANKALWDEYFFSSITPRNPNVELFGKGGRLAARDVAKNFFLRDVPLPNRRIVPYKDEVDENRLNELFSQADDFQGGLADKIASHLMVKGAFNVNSTSVEAWRVLLSSLKDQPVAYLDTGRAMSGAGGEIVDVRADGVPVAGFSLPSAVQHSTGMSDPSVPEQWLGSRVLTEEQIDELAQAIVRQVKLRGPFLSMSEFINRRLDSENRELSVKGALQAAVDDPQVSINAAFREGVRSFSPDEISDQNPAFPEALEGPVAYGSSAYVDQADILRNLAEQLTPRGDTFIIRTYGDSLDASGKVVARAWCEAVLQRVPEYVDATDENYLKTADLQSATNKTYGRKIEIISFRWLNKNEV